MTDLTAMLRACNLNEVYDVPYKDLVTLARLVKVIDGDTIKVLILLGTQPLSLKVRLVGIDAPEVTLKGRTTLLEKTAGLVVKQYVFNLLKGSEVYIKLTKLDKYGGRYVGHVYKTQACVQNNNCISTQLLSLKYAKAYDGGKKITWETKDLEYIIKQGGKK
jgi:endonuclease YncB( thermonuclease family)